MATNKVIYGFSQLSDDSFYALAQRVVESMTDNAHYPAPAPSLADVSAAVTEYGDALVLRGGGKETTAAKNEKRRVLQKLLGELALYVQANCQDNLTILLSSGFEARKVSAPVGMLLKPENFKVENGPNAGSMKLMVDKVFGADNYVFECAIAPATETTPWTSKISSGRSLMIEGLTSGVKYAFRVAAAGSHPTLVYSEIINRYTQ